MTLILVSGHARTNLSHSCALSALIQEMTTWNDTKK